MKYCNAAAPSSGSEQHHIITSWKMLTFGFQSPEMIPSFSSSIDPGGRLSTSDHLLSGRKSHAVMESEILKFICANQGAVDTDFLMYNLTGDSINDVISTGDNFVLCCPFGQPKVVARTSLKLCRNRDCLASCRGLHLCKKFLLTGSCPFTHSRRGCRFSHELDSDHNVEVLTAHGLESLSRAELCTLLLQSDASLLPQVCHDYNNGGGEVGLCQEGYACKRLHVCERFLNRECSCSKAHDFSALQPSKSLQERGIPEDLFPSLKSIYANILALKYADRKGDGGRGRGAFRGNNRGGNRGNRGNRGSRSNSQQRQQFSSDGLRGWTSFSDLFSADNDEESSEPNPFSHQTRPAADVAGADGPNRKQRPVRDKTEICMYFIKGHCRHSDERCFKVHDKMPYRWEVEEGDRWTALADNEEIEKDYCDPKNAYSRSSPQVHFDTMTCGSKKVRRLSTANSLLEPTFIHTTEWVWFWEDEFGKWNTYAAAANGRSASDVDSDKLEQKFLENDKDVVDFTAGSQSYSLSFQDMMQTNKQYGTKKPVKRRPRFVSAADVKTKRVRRPPGQANFTAVPDHWDKTQTPQPGFKRLPLLHSSEEFKKIESLFCETMRGFDLVRIERIQNKSLWEVFQWQKNEMKTKNKGRNVTEKQLFHGTDSKYVDVICHTNFDWRVCGVNGTAFGQGSYFARDAKYSHSYTGDADVRSMFVSRVLVGDFTKGESSYRRPPSKDGGDINLFDSCVNDVHDPSIFVVFEKHQIYPEYLLQYKTTHPLIALYGAARPAPAPAPRPAPAPAPAPRPAPAPAPAPRPAPQPVRPAVQPSRSLSQPSASVYSYSSASYQPSRTFKPAMPSPPPKKNDSCVIA